MKEACFSAEDIDALLSSMGKGDILVGGQSLAFWVGCYDIKFKLPADVAAISMDSDILGTKSSARRIASSAGGRVTPAPKDAITIEHENDSFLNIDIIDRINGLTNEEIRKRALPVGRGKQSFLVMRPVDVFVSSIKSSPDQVRGRLFRRMPEAIKRERIASKSRRWRDGDLFTDSQSFLNKVAAISPRLPMPVCR